MTSVCIYEDSGYKALQPLTSLRPSYDLFLGTSTLVEKCRRQFNPRSLILHCREALKSVMKRRNPGASVNMIVTGIPTLFINGRVIMTPELKTELEAMGRDKDF